MNAQRDADGRLTASLNLAPWTVVLEIPRQAFQRPIYATTGKLLAGLLAALLVGFVAGKISSRLLVRGVAALLDAPGADLPRPDIVEIAAARDHLDAAEAQRLADVHTLLASEGRFTATFE